MLYPLVKPLHLDEFPGFLNSSSLPIYTDGVAVRMNAQRPLSAAPLATSRDRHERWCAITLQDRAQVRGRASGVRCKAMLGGELTRMQEIPLYNE